MENSKPGSINSAIGKALFVGILTLLLLIPLLFVQNLVNERSHRKDQVVRQIANQWSNSQQVSALKIKIPTTRKVVNVEKVNGKKQEVISYIDGEVFWSPAYQKIQGNIDTKVKKLSIYEAILYNTQLEITGFFDRFSSEEKDTDYHFDKAELILEISDFRGLENDLNVTFDGQMYKMQNATDAYVSKALGNWDPKKEKQAFNFKLDLKGSSKLSFYPSAGLTEVEIKSEWQHPGFYGAFLPTHDINSEGFRANWRVLELNRSLPRVNNSIGNVIVPESRPSTYEYDNIKVNGSRAYEFGVNLVETANNYQKNERASKYGILIIALTFMAFYFIELFFKKRINLLHYLLVGLALIIFYTLLLSISEFLMFNASYLASSILTIGLIMLFAKSLFGQWRPALMISGILAILNGFIFTIIQLEDTALLVGSIGLFVILAITMYVSRVIKLD